MAVNPERMTRKLVSLPHELLRAIDDFRFENRIRTEAEAIRRLIALGLKASAMQPEPERPDPPGAH